MRKTEKPKTPTNPLADLDMNAPLPILTDEQKQKMVEAIKATIAKFTGNRRPRCTNGRGCPMCRGPR